ETAGGRVLRSRSAATAVFWLKSSKLSAWTARAYSFREAAAAVAILPAPLLSMLLIFSAVSVIRSIGFIRGCFRLLELNLFPALRRTITITLHLFNCPRLTNDGYNRLRYHKSNCQPQGALSQSG